MHHVKKIKLYRTNRSGKLLSELLQEFTPIINKARKPYRSRAYYEDLFNSGVVGFLRGIEKFNVNTNGTAYLYLSKSIQGEIMNEVKRQYELNPEEQKAVEEVVEKANIFDRLTNPHRFFELLSSYDETDQAIVMLHSYNYSFEEIAMELSRYGLTNDKAHTIRRRYLAVISDLKDLHD